MKKFAIIISLVSLSLVFAAGEYQATQDAIGKLCHGKTSQDYFMKGFDCSGAEKELFYIKDTKVIKAVFDATKKMYDEKGDICDKDQQSKPSDLPEGFSLSCVKGQYGVYVANGKKVSFKEFGDAIGALLVSTIASSNNIEVKKQLNKDLEGLASEEAFASALRLPSNEGDNNPYTFSMSYSILGSSCIGSGSILFNGNGYKNLVCNNKKVTSLDLYLNNVKVDEKTYVSAMYKVEKEKAQKSLEYVSQQVGSGNGGGQTALPVVTPVVSAPALPTSTSSGCTGIPSALKKMPIALGMKNTDVLAVQQFLSKQGYLTVKPTDTYTASTAAAVKNYQKKHHILATGTVGPITMQSMRGNCK